MEYRALAGQKELDAYVEMVRLAFNMSREELKFYQEVFPLTLENSRGYFDDEGRLLCGLGILEDGAIYYNTPEAIPTALITAVATPPEQRRKGYVRQMFDAMFEEQRSLGVALTALYPFYFPFYRSFGYELAHDAAQYTVKIDQFKPWRKSVDRGRFEPLDIEAINKDTDAGKEILATLDSLYLLWARERSGMVQRDRRWWRQKMTHKTEYIPSYMYYDEQGKAAGYIFYHLEDKGNWEREMGVREMFGRDRVAWEALFGFIFNHDSQASKVTFWQAVDVPLAMEFPDPREAEIKVRPGYMLRLLDVAGAFSKRKFAPHVEGGFSFALTDEMLPTNSGVYRVSVSGGSASVERIQQGEAAGLLMDERTLAQLYAGYISPKYAASIGKVQVVCEADLQIMQALLHPDGQPAPYMADGF
jgi:predicted acetyltransferase